jgi:hypothetical protein
MQNGKAMDPRVNPAGDGRSTLVAPAVADPSVHVNAREENFFAIFHRLIRLV